MPLKEIQNSHDASLLCCTLFATLIIQPFVMLNNFPGNRITLLSSLLLICFYITNPLTPLKVLFGSFVFVYNCACGLLVCGSLLGAAECLGKIAV